MERIVGVIIIVVSAYLLFSLRSAPFSAAAFPGGLLALLMLAALPLLRTRAPERYEFRNTRDVACAAALMGLYAALLPRLGFLASTTGLMLASLLLSGYRTAKIKALLISLAVAVVIHWPFVHILNVPLP